MLTRLDIPDAPARAFRDADGQVHLIASHYVTRADGRAEPRLRAGTIAPRVMRLGSRRRPCALLRPRDGSRRRYTRKTGGIVYALVHNEYQGDKHVGQLPVEGYAEVLVQLDHAGPLDRRRTHLHAAGAAGPSGRVGATYRYEPDAGPLRAIPAQQHSRVTAPRTQGIYYALIQAERVQRAAGGHVRDPHVASGSAGRLARMGRQRASPCGFANPLRRRRARPRPCLRAGVDSRRSQR